MIQNIIAFAIIFLAIGFVIYRIVQRIKKGNKKKSACGDCSGCCFTKSYNCPSSKQND